MQQKVAIARAFLTRPILLLLDEPTTGLDPRSKREVQAFMEGLRDNHDATILLTTHDMQEADALCDRIAILDEGRNPGAASHLPPGGEVRQAHWQTEAQWVEGEWRMKPTLIIDADDTLWENNIYYEQCIATFVELMVAQGFRREEVERTVDAVERERIPQVGYAPEEFAHSLVIAYQRLCQSHDRPIKDEVVDRVWAIGQAVIEYPIVLLDGVAETLVRLSGRFHLLLLTKGDREAQESKVARSGLGHLFDGVHIVPEKDAEVIRGLLTRYDLEPEQTWMVGNSPRSDINPAIEAGIGAIYVPHPNTWNLEIEEIAEPERVVVLRCFRELSALFAGTGEAGGDL